MSLKVQPYRIPSRFKPPQCMKIQNIDGRPHLVGCVQGDALLAAINNAYAFPNIPNGQFSLRLPLSSAPANCMQTTHSFRDQHEYFNSCQFSQALIQAVKDENPFLFISIIDAGRMMDLLLFVKSGGIIFERKCLFNIYDGQMALAGDEPTTHDIIAKEIWGGALKANCVAGSHLSVTYDSEIALFRLAFIEQSNTFASNADSVYGDLPDQVAQEGRFKRSFFLRLIDEFSRQGLFQIIDTSQEDNTDIVLINNLSATAD